MSQHTPFRPRERVGRIIAMLEGAHLPADPQAERLRDFHEMFNAYVVAPPPGSNSGAAQKFECPTALHACEAFRQSRSGYDGRAIQVTKRVEIYTTVSALAEVCPRLRQRVEEGRTRWRGDRFRIARRIPQDRIHDDGLTIST